LKVPATSSESGIAQQRSSFRLFLQVWLLFPLALGMHGVPTQAQTALVVVGSGSSVPAPLYSRWAQEFDKRNISLQMRYVAVGTSEGIKQISHGAGDFAAGEAQLTDKEREDGGLVELPVVLVGIVPIYNLPDNQHELRLSGEVLAEIFLGNVKTWNAPQIAKLNPEMSLPSLPIQVINRPAGKGSNYVFTDFLSKVSSKFQTRIGISSSPKWPVGEPVERSADMADKVKNTLGSVGYVEYQYAVKNNIPQAAVQNPSGKFVKGSNESMAAACTAAEAPRWNNFSASLTNARGADAFPITSFSWIYLRTSTSDPSRAAGLNDLLNWIYTDGQQYAVEEGYFQLPPLLLAAVRKKVNELK
jgi:phosphate transport system substrate-binding protein